MNVKYVGSSGLNCFVEQLLTPTSRSGLLPIGPSGRF
jgi:hypothetical protein